MALRKYQVIWNRIKAKNRCMIETHPALVARVKKAVIKEKWRDVGFKFQNDHDHFFLDISVEAIPDVYDRVRITFELRQSIGIEGRKDT